jgi:mRNA interferase MazF
MLVVQNDTNNARMAKTILVFITTYLARASEPTQVFVDVQTADGRSSGLKQDSVVSCENLLTDAQSDILRTIGHLPAPLMQRVDQALKVSLDLP